MTYDYRAGKQRIQNILDNQLDVIEQGKLPKDGEFTFDNAYYSWVTAVFVDIRDSTSLCKNEDKTKVSKVLRSFTSEVIEILRDSDNLREIGIRGDCVYAIYTTPFFPNVYDVFDKAVDVNTFMKMLNSLLSNKGLPNISVGIGISTAQELVIKAGRKGVRDNQNVPINNKVWIGDAVTKASNFSSLGNKDGIGSIVISRFTYSYIKDELLKNSNGQAENWFELKYSQEFGDYYHAHDVVNVEFNAWIGEEVPLNLFAHILSKGYTG
jgi:class 3 adenylate cyclase